MPKISIVTPSYNQGEFIEETIQSILNQKYDNLEYVIIDGGSTDNSVDIIKKYENSLHYWISEKDEGHGHALNKGFSQTSGEIMAWINSDDKYMPWTLRTVAEIFTLFPHVDWIVGINSWFNRSGAMVDAARVPKNIHDFLLGNSAWIQQESVFWRRRIWDKTGGYINQNYKFMVDGELWTRFFLHADLYAVDCVLAGYRFHSANRARNNYPCCLQEMAAAIADMKMKCPREVIRKNNVYRILMNINKYLFLGSSPFPKVVSMMFPGANYKSIIFEDENWLEGHIPFRF